MTADPVLASVHIWMGDYALLETEPGGRFHLDIKGASVRGHYLDLDPP